ncbi:MAG: phosphatase [Fretibacterium sp.]|nr:phosphatase [Fretibacterium sp.]
MKLLFDLHSHTSASQDGYSTLLENITFARGRGLMAYGISEHSGGLPVAARQGAFDNLKVVPREVDGLKIYRGVETNIIDYKGGTDLDRELVLPRVDYVIASLHPPCLRPGSVTENTDALIGAMAFPEVAIIGHPDDSRYPLDYEALILAAKETGKLLELNNSSLLPRCGRQNGPENVREMLLKCAEHGARIVVNSDSHICFDVGRFDEAEALLAELDFPSDLIANVDLTRLSWVGLEAIDT